MAVRSSSRDHVYICKWRGQVVHGNQHTTSITRAECLEPNLVGKKGARIDIVDHLTTYMYTETNTTIPERSVVLFFFCGAFWAYMVE